MVEGSPLSTEGFVYLSGSPSSSPGSTPSYFACSRRSNNSQYLQQVLRNSFDLSWTRSLRSPEKTRFSSPLETEKGTSRKTSLRQHDGLRRGDEEAEKIAQKVARRGRAYVLAIEWDKGSCSSMNMLGVEGAGDTSAGENLKCEDRKTVPSVQEALSAFDPSEEDRRKDLTVALAWIRHELHELRREDTQLLSTFHAIRRGISYVRVQQEKRRSGGCARSSTIRNRSRRVRQHINGEATPDSSKDSSNFSDVRKESTGAASGATDDLSSRPRAASVELASWRLEESSSLPSTPVCERVSYLNKEKSGSAPLLDLDDEQDMTDRLARPRSATRRGQNRLQLKPLSLEAEQTSERTYLLTPVISGDLSDKLHSASRPPESPRLTHFTLGEAAARTPMRGTRNSVKVRPKKSPGTQPSLPSSHDEESALIGTRISKAASILGMTPDDVIDHSRRMSMTSQKSLSSVHSLDNGQETTSSLSECDTHQMNGFWESDEVGSSAAHTRRAGKLAIGGVSGKVHSHQRRESCRAATEGPSDDRRRQKMAFGANINRVYKSLDIRNARQRSASLFDEKGGSPILPAPMWARGLSQGASVEEDTSTFSTAVGSSNNAPTTPSRPRSKTHKGLIGLAYKALKTRVKGRRRSNMAGVHSESALHTLSGTDENHQGVLMMDSQNEGKMSTFTKRDLSRTAFSAMDVREADFTSKDPPPNYGASSSLQDIHEEFSLDLNSMALQTKSKHPSINARSTGSHYLC